jgi:cell division protein FtsB
MDAPLSKRDPVRLSLKRLGMVALFAAVCVVGAGVWDVYNKEKESRALRTQAEAQLKDLSNEQAHLDQELSNLKTERGKEETLREHYDVGKQGEGLIIIVEPTIPQSVKASSTLERILHKALFWR